MRYLFGFMCVLALGVMGCAEGDGGDPFPGNCGGQGQGGGGAYVHPGLYVAFLPGVVLPYRACVYVNEDCTELEASTECNIGEDDSQAHFLEVQWTDGRTDIGDECAAAVSVTTDLVSKIPIAGNCSAYNCTSFGIEFSDDQGAAWVISGFWSYDDLLVTAQRTTDDGVCRPYFEYDYGVVDDPKSMALVPADWFPPEVVDFDFDPKQVDVTTAPADVVCEATLFHPAGVDYLHCAYRSPSGEQIHSCRSDSPRSGESKEGVWSCTVTIPQDAEPGLWDFRIRHRSTGTQLEVISR